MSNRTPAMTREQAILHLEWLRGECVEDGQWLDLDDREALEMAVSALRQSSAASPLGSPCWCGSEPCVGPKNLLPGFACAQAIERYRLTESSAVQELEALRADVSDIAMLMETGCGEFVRSVQLIDIHELIDARLLALKEPV